MISLYGSLVCLARIVAHGVSSTVSMQTMSRDKASTLPYGFGSTILVSWRLDVDIELCPDVNEGVARFGISNDANHRGVGEESTDETSESEDEESEQESEDEDSESEEE